MAIRPVDLQLAYMATPQNAAQVASAQEAPAAASAAQAAAFAADVTKREEQVQGAAQAKGGKVNARGERDAAQQQARKRKFLPDPSGAQDEAPQTVGRSGDGEHFIDVMA